MSATYKVFKEEKLAKEIRPKCLKYLKSLLLSNTDKYRVPIIKKNLLKNF